MRRLCFALFFAEYLRNIHVHDIAFGDDTLYMPSYAKACCVRVSKNCYSAMLSIVSYKRCLVRVFIDTKAVSDNYNAVNYGRKLYLIIFSLNDYCP